MSSKSSKTSSESLALADKAVKSYKARKHDIDIFLYFDLACSPVSYQDSDKTYPGKPKIIDVYCKKKTTDEKKGIIVHWKMAPGKLINKMS